MDACLCDCFFSGEYCAGSAFLFISPCVNGLKYHMATICRDHYGICPQMPATIERAVTEYNSD